MDEKDSDVKRALDDIFGDDVIEINTETNIDNKEQLDKNLSNALQDVIDSEFVEPSLLEEDNVKDEPILDSKENESSFNKKILIYFIVGFVIGLVLIYFIVNYFNGKEKVVNCSYQAEDVGYKVTDEYKITYKNDNILYVESVYNYIAKNDEYKTQIEYIKKEKLPVIINSNGMSGFTYIYETSENFFKVSGYLDFTLFNYDKISKINQSITPISYFKIESKQSFKELSKNLEKQGYVCTISK